MLLGTQCICIQKTWKNHLFLSILSFLGTKWLKKGHFWCSQNPVTSRYYGEKPTINGENEVRLASLSKFSLLLCDPYKKKNVNHRSSNILGTLYRSTRWPHMLTEFFRNATVEKFPNHIFWIVICADISFHIWFLMFPFRYFEFF